ncbi:cysteine proteinase [Penicillium macrosclerotiorum]|uniref:cysteine proteinase n=1 Tax=Penicillium macrosclerotiorum TaxID=303699 RepID=UPI0025480A13|nr:cysteine proteinase [Penicillium macrosclerotiorum]KAJ5673804.1 cysteine proteinase [Penicillium macrosclerotiorum]
MRGPTIIKAEDDKTRQLNKNTLMAFSGEAGDTVQFAEYIQANIQLYSMRNDTELNPAAVSNFVRGELARSLRSRNPYTVNLLLGGMDPTTEQPHLYWIDYLASLAPVPYAAHGYAQYYCLSLLDKHHNPNIDLEEGMKLLGMCTDELKRRLPIDYKGLKLGARADRIEPFDCGAKEPQHFICLPPPHVTMSKRQAELPLGENFPGSPASKKARLEDDVASDDPNGNSFTRVHDQELEHDKRNGTQTRTAIDLEEKELQEESSDVSGSSDLDEEAPALSAPKRQTQPIEGYGDLYLDTVNRGVLDFDFEKLCSVSLSNINVYACLVCGKYFQGRGPKSHAYFHALEIGHHPFINMGTKKVYVLPEGYEVKSKSLEDIKYVVDPHFTKDEVMKLDKEVHDAWDLSGSRYRPGFVGMNNIKANDYLNVVVQLLAHVHPIRNFFLLHKFPAPGTPELALRFSTLVRKLWNPKAFRSHVSPHELLQEIALRSSKRFTLTQQSDPVEFLSWFLNNLHLSLGGSKKPSSTPTSIIQAAFQGQLRIESQAITAHSDTQNARLVFTESGDIKSQVTPFLILTLDLPPTPLFQSANRESIIPQVPLTTLLNKYNGLTASEKMAQRVRHRLLHPLPPFLLFHIKRFSKNRFVSERNPTIVTFPSPRSLDMSPYVEPNPDVWPPGEPIMYDLVANIILDPAVAAPGATEDAAEKGVNAATGSGGSSGAGAGAGSEKVSWLVQLHDKAVSTETSRHTGGTTEQQQRGAEWLEIQDLFVKRAESETLFTREGYLMVWERRKVPGQKGKSKLK